MVVWKSADGSDVAKSYEGIREYDLSDKGELFWIDWLGPNFEWMKPKLDWNPSTDFYNFEDLDRVENNTEIVAGLLSYFVSLPPLLFFTNRNMKRIEFADNLNRIEGNQDVLRQRFTPVGWMDNKLDWKPNTAFSYIDARRLENNMHLLYWHYKGNAEAIPFCGTFSCGEEVI